ncbi:DUF3558 family protein [Corynebacterium pilosum]|uniref:Secreted protein n=1 Tax=Corynebacterium pilosum TaxID=35756 RepID=A0A376CMQ1_9CORY|nr:DUF3558 family protein [Corynebacterium pilosum]STC69487.1 Uncharacterised protein [Corynebacterium pilosum]
MKLRIGAVVVALSSLLPACSAAGDAEPAAAVTEVVTEVVEPEPDIETVDAFHFESGTLELGPFDPLEVYPDVFDPCQEISDEEFAELGYTTDGVTVPLNESTLMGCTLLSTDTPVLEGLLLSGNLASKDDFLQQTEIISDDISAEVPGMFLFVAPDEEFNNCGAVVSTERGHLIAFSADASKPYNQEVHCQRAIKFLERLKEL